MRVVWLPRARDQLLAIVRHISLDSPQAAIDLAQLIRAQTDTLSRYPDRCPAGRVKGTREMVVKPNYILIYRVTEDVEILRVRHARMQF